ncbi:MAG TPA: hypothetical protein VJZ51_02465 [Bacilli bacterium]|nr:hypothetical protein [Bacilli bacterium]
MRKLIKILIIVLVFACGLTSVSVNAARGYIYSHNGQIIHSSVGFSATSDGIYNVISDAWGGKIAATELTSPEDLFIFTETNEDEEGNIAKQDKIYVVDSVSNKLFVFDENMNYLETVTRFEVVPDNFNNTQLLAMKTKKVVSSAASSVLFAEGMYSFASLRAVQTTPYQDRTESQKFYIEPLKLSGVYRSVRYLRDENNIIVEGEYEDLIYLSDNGNSQILIVDAKTYKVVQIVSSPTDVTFAGKTFSPTKVVTDSAGRLYVISDGIYEGIMLMSNRGIFMRFVGVNYTTLSFWDALWRNLATETQRKQMSSILQTEFKNFTIDDQGFIYTVSRASTNPDTGVSDSTKMIKRINQAGKDVLTRNGYAVPKGDLITILSGTNAGGSQFSSIAINDFGVYTVADSRSGRLFTYDNEGNLLYISAGNGDEISDLRNPVAVRYQGENVLVLDKNNKTVIRYQPTEIAKIINKAVKYHYEGDLESSSEQWANVITENPNYEYAYVGIGKTLITGGRYQEAMLYFKTGYSVEYYSKAYKLYRDEIIKNYFPYAMSAVLGLIAIGVGLSTYKRIRNKKPGKLGKGEEDE